MRTPVRPVPVAVHLVRLMEMCVTTTQPSVGLGIPFFDWLIAFDEPVGFTWNP